MTLTQKSVDHDQRRHIVFMREICQDSFRMPLPIVRLTPELTSSSPWDWALWLHHAIELDNGSPCPLPALIDLSENSEENSQFLQQLNNASLKPSSCTGSISQPIRSGGCIWPQQGNDLNAVGRERKKPR